MAPDEQAIRELHATWIAAVNARDLGRLLGLMADDVVFLGPGQAPFGRDGFSAGFSAAHQRARVHCVSELEEVVVVGAVAYTRARDSLSVTPRDTSTRPRQTASTSSGRATSTGSGQAPSAGSGRGDGEAMQFAGHRLTVYRKHPDGRWLLARDAHTLTLVAKPGA